MAFTSLEALVATAAALPVAGVHKQMMYRSPTIDSSDLPLMFTRLPRSDRGLSTLTYGQGLKHGTIEIVIMVQFSNLNQQTANDEITVQIMDSLAVSLESNAEALGMDNYQLETADDSIGDGATPVQAIIATVEVSG